MADAVKIIASLYGDEPPTGSKALVRNAWRGYNEFAHRSNGPGIFSTTIGFRWTAIGGYNPYRDVLFRSEAGAAIQTLPLSQYYSKTPQTFGS